MVRAHGWFRITHGHGHAAGFWPWLLRLPRASEAAETRLSVTPDANGERWRRTFGDRYLDTRQYQAGEGVFLSGVRDLYAALEPPYGSWPWKSEPALAPRR